MTPRPSHLWPCALLATLCCHAAAQQSSSSALDDLQQQIDAAKARAADQAKHVRQESARKAAPRHPTQNAQTPPAAGYFVTKITITGNKSVSTDRLMAAVQVQPGGHATVRDIIADQDAIARVLQAAHVVGGVKTGVKTQNGQSEVIFTIDDRGTQAPTIATLLPKLDAQYFQGNVALTADQLAAATGLNPGDGLSDSRLATAQQAIAAAYKAANLPVRVTISGQNKRLASGTYDVIWTITETPANHPP